MAIQKETTEYNANFLAEWGRFCDQEEYVKRQASHAALMAFMQMLDAEQREQAMQLVMALVAASRKRSNNSHNNGGD